MKSFEVAEPPRSKDAAAASELTCNQRKPPAGTCMAWRRLSFSKQSGISISSNLKLQTPLVKFTKDSSNVSLSAFEFFYTVIFNGKI